MVCFVKIFGYCLFSHSLIFSFSHSLILTRAVRRGDENSPRGLWEPFSRCTCLVVSVGCRRCDFHWRYKGTKFSALQQIIIPKRHGKRHASANRSCPLVQMADGSFLMEGMREGHPRFLLLYNIYIIYIINYQLYHFYQGRQSMCSYRNCHLPSVPKWMIKIYMKISWYILAV